MAVRSHAVDDCPDKAFALPNTDAHKLGARHLAGVVPSHDSVFRCLVRTPVESQGGHLSKLSGDEGVSTLGAVDLLLFVEAGLIVSCYRVEFGAVEKSGDVGRIDACQEIAGIGNTGEHVL